MKEKDKYLIKDYGFIEISEVEKESLEYWTKKTNEVKKQKQLFLFYFSAWELSIFRSSDFIQNDSQEFKDTAEKLLYFDRKCYKATVKVTIERMVDRWGAYNSIYYVDTVKEISFKEIKKPKRKGRFHSVIRIKNTCSDDIKKIEKILDGIGLEYSSELEEPGYYKEKAELFPDIEGDKNEI